MVDFLFALIELFRYLLRFRSYKVKYVQLGCLHRRGRPLCTQILHRQGRPTPTIFGIRKLETLDYATVKTASFCIPCVDTIPECDGETDRQTDMPHSKYSACKASFAARCKKQTELDGESSRVLLLF